VSGVAAFGVYLCQRDMHACRARAWWRLHHRDQASTNPGSVGVVHTSATSRRGQSYLIALLDRPFVDMSLSTNQLAGNLAAAQ
jgi:hypothetical protein